MAVNNPPQVPVDVVATFDNAGTVLPTGVANLYYEVQSPSTLAAWALTGTPSGSVSINVLKATGAIPMAGDSIVAAAPPNLVSTQLGNSSALTGWTTAIAAGDVLGFDIISAIAITKAVLTLKVLRY